MGRLSLILLQGRDRRVVCGRQPGKLLDARPGLHCKLYQVRKGGIVARPGGIATAL